MMKNIDIGQTLQIAANVAVLAGMIFLAYELRQNTQSARSASSEDYLSGAYELDLRIAQDPGVAELLLKARNPESLSEVDQLRLDRWYYAALRQWENAYYLYTISALDETFWLAYRNELKRILGGGALFPQYWASNKDSFTPGFDAEMEAMLRELHIE